MSSQEYINEQTMALKIQQKLFEWRHTKSIALSSEICEILLTNDGNYDESDLDEIEQEFNLIMYGKGTI